VATVIHLIRHGEVENPGNIRYGQLHGFGLSRRGELQARAAGRYLRGAATPIAAIISSPLERAIQTATLLQIELALAGFELDEQLIEAPNQFDGQRRTAPLYPWNWRVLRDPFTPSWGEPFSDVARRMQTAIAGHGRRHAGRHIALVSHQSPIWLARLAYEGRRLPPWLSRVRCTHASITSLELDGDRCIAHRYWEPPR